MTHWLCLPAALGLDLLLGDPQCDWHPVRLIGKLAAWGEQTMRRKGSSQIHGTLGWVLVVGTTLACTAGLLAAAQRIGTLCESVVSALLIYITIAPRDLAQHASRVADALRSGDLAEARRAVGNIVGRDTDVMDASDVSRATVEAVAESTVDGVTAPLLYACLLGPMGAVGYRVINTLDSMWGHRDKRYEQFGWGAARADDLAGLVPARLTSFWIAGAAALCGFSPLGALRVAQRDGRKHQSPNSGLAEAAFAGALGVVLGGRNRYDGAWSDDVTFGIGLARPCLETIRDAVRLMMTATLLCTTTLTFLPMSCTGWWS